MLSRKKIILSIIFIVLIALITLIYGNEVHAYSTFTPSELYTLGYTYDPNVYCLNHGWEFRSGKAYYPLNSGNLSPELSYCIYQGKQESNYNKNDPNSLAYIIKYVIWQSELGYEHASSVAIPEEVAEKYADLMKEAELSKNLKRTGNISINKPTEELMFENPSENGKYGPFNITYPSYLSQETGEYKALGDEFKILLNGQEVSQLPKSGEDFYLTEADGIKIGEKNTLKIQYKAHYNFRGTYTRYTALRDCIADAWCRTCQSHIDRIRIQGFIDYQTKEMYLPANIAYNFTCNNPSCSFTDPYIMTTTLDQYIKLNQDVISTNVNCDPIEEEQEIEFLVGRKIVIDLNKKDNMDRALQNISFDVQLIGTDVSKTYIKQGTNKATNATITTDASGKAQIEIISYEDSVKVTIDEVNSQYYINPGTITIDFNYTQAGWTHNIVTPASGATNGNLVSITPNRDGIHFELDIINKLKIEKIKLIKTNSSISGEFIPGVTFRIILDNAITEDGQSSIIKVTDANGEIDLGTLEIIDASKNVTATIEEINVPASGDVNYKGLYGGGEVTVTIWHAEKCEITISGADSDIATAEYNLENNIVTINIKNEVTIDITGIVWEDGQTGIKPVKASNSIRDASEKGIPNVKVVIKNASDDAIVGETYTDGNGAYSFKDLPASVNGAIGYYVEFTYDGINYIAVTPNVGGDESIDSDAIEENRDVFNNRFSTITKGKSSDGTALEYDTTSDPNKAILITMNGTEVKQEFAMLATTKPTTYNKNTSNVDLGLLKKGVDLAAVTDIYSAKVTINGEEINYSYNDIISMNDNITVNTDPTAKYNLYLYNSDYNYRINDYSALPVLDTATTKLESPTDNENLLENKKNQEIEVELIYRVLLNNQSATDAIINEVAYYYDPTLELVSPMAQSTQVTIGGKTYNKVIYPINQLFTDANNQGIFDIVFHVNKDANKNIILGEKNTWVEITSYSTDTGCIDIDSAPDNILEHRTEDDTDDARGLNIEINDVDRTISGFVFEDKKINNTANGYFDGEDEKVSDVIVQLIEIRNVNGRRLEYIWQETVSGSNTVKYVTSDGRNIATYNVSNEPGHYTFKDFIPGTYIVRFIYGDGTYFDNTINGETTSTSSQASILKYNGQDYKSTIDSKYDEDMVDLRTYNLNASMARDNEARRLYEMAYATSVTNISDLIIDNKAKLANTWMCAETSKFIVPVSDEVYTDQQQNQTADYSGGSKKQVTRSANFGLVKRPEQKLQLEKHVTSINIEGTNIEVSANIRDYSDNGRDVKLIQNNVGVLATATNKEQNQRGSWLIQTPVEDVQGRTMTIGYGYIVKNVGEIDYIGQLLKEKIIDGERNGKSYSQIYTEEAQRAKEAIYSENYNIGNLLGEMYYSGRQNNDTPAVMKVKIEDYIKGVSFTNNSRFLRNETATTEEKTKNIWKLTSEGDAIKDKETVDYIINSEILALGGNISEYVLDGVKVTTRIDGNSGTKQYKYRSYAAQLVPVNGMTTEVGTTIDGLADLPTVQSYVDNLEAVPISLIVPGDDEFIGETVEITVNTGADKQSPVMLIITISSGMILIAVGVILIKKFIIK